MDIAEKNVEENTRYSFLLGCALRNQDPDQFLQVYDTIVPKDCDPEQVDLIKDEARKISELPEKDFNHLVSNARDYSLARSAPVTPGDNKVNQVESESRSDIRDTTSDISNNVTSNNMTTNSLTDHSDLSGIKYIDDDEDSGGATSPKVSLKSLERTSRNMSRKWSDMSVDSGVCNSSKTTIGSASDADLDIDENEQRGVFDYFPSTKETPEDEKPVMYNRAGYVNKRPVEIRSTNRHIVNSHDKAYDVGFNADEEIPVDDSPRSISSDHDFRTSRSMSDGPRSTEMKTFRVTNNTYDEVLNIEDSDDDLKSVNVHDRLYGKHNDYAHMQTEEGEDYEFDEDRPVKSNGPMKLTGPKLSSDQEISFSKKNYSIPRINHNSLNKNLSNRSGNPDVDTAVTFPLNQTNAYINQRRYGDPSSRMPSSTSSDSVRIEKTIVPNIKEVNNPPFPSGKDHMQAIQQRVNDIYDKPITKDVPNLPQGEPIATGNPLELGMATDPNKKKKKKKKTASKDDSYSGELDKSGNHESTDLNGNPIEGLQYGSKAARSKGGRLENEHSRIPSTLSQIEGYQLGKTQIRDMDSTTTNDAKNEYEKKKIRQQRKKDKKNEQIKVAKDLPGNVGTQNMDKLLEFIGEKPKANGPNNLGTSGKVKSKKHKEKKGVELVGGGGSDNGDDATESKGSSEASEGKHKDTISECSSSGSGTNNSDNMKDNLSDKPASIGDGNRSDVISEVLDSTNIDTPSYYIFTDIEPVPKVEEAFQKVDRKKKKHVTPHNNHTHNHHLSSYPSSHRTHPHQRDNFQHRDQIREKERNSTIPNPHVESEPPKRPTLAVRSITPPPSVEGQKERALSPSAFPALGGGRRNSTGTVTALEVQAPPSDSDVESVRSLPLPSDSIPPVISYAKIAASPKPKDKGPSAAMVKIIAQGTGNTERRHSVGSLNDSINSCKQQEGDSNEKKYSSQELPTTEIEAAARDSVRRKLTDMDNMAAPSVASSLAKSMDIVSKPDFPTLSEVTQYRGPTSPPIGGSNVDHSNENTSKTPHISKSKSDDLVVAHSSASHSDIKDLEGKKTAEESNTSLTSSKSFTLGIKQKPKQSVVFLGNDKLTSPLNLGISFGFDDKELEALTLDSHQAPQENFTIESDIGNKDSGISFGGDQCIDVDNVATAYEALKMNGIVAPPRELSLCEKISQRTLPQMTSSERQVYYEKQRGNFNLEEMVKYLVKEWERTVELKEKSPNQVLAYTAA